MEALVNLNPVYGVSLSKAIFANGVLNFSNKTTITGNNGPDADIYSNQSVACANNENFAGSVYSQGDIGISNACSFAGNAWAAGKVTTGAGSSGTIAGFVKAGGGVINLSGVSVTGNLYASSTITYGGCATPGKCFSSSSPGSPPASPFPIIKGTTATTDVWASNGYTVVMDSGACNAFQGRVATDYSQRGYPTLVRTSCQAAFSGVTVSQKNDLAIFADGGFTASNPPVTFQSSVAGVSHNLYWIQPYDAVTIPCSSTGISTSQQFTVSGDIDQFLYSPCNISFSNQSTHVGQIYGGNAVTINNQFNMQFKPVPVFGIDPSSSPTVSYTPSIVYKRETI